MSRFLDALRSGRVLLMDGAMGTELQRAGVRPGESYELWNLTHPESVRRIHRSYVAAGASVLLTNTFQANTVALAKHSLAESFDRIAAAAIELARGESPPEVFVVASAGPIANTLDVWEYQRMTESFQATDALLLETLSSLDIVPICIRTQASSDGPALPVLASIAFLRGAGGQLWTIERQTPEVVARRATSIPGLAALGVNCGRDISMDDCIEIVRRYRSVTDLPLFARPNAGTPRQVNGQWVYPRSPEEMAAKLPELLEAGLSMVGGCCGTTPAHIAAFRPVVDAWNNG